MRIRACVTGGTCLLLGVLVACSGNRPAPSVQPTAPNPPEIAVLLPDTRSSARWEDADKVFMEKAFQAAGLTEGDYAFHNAAGDPAIQRSQADSSIRQGVKVLVLASLDDASGAAIIEQAHAADVTVVDYDSLTAGGGADYYVTGDVVAAGRLQGEGLVSDLKKLKKPRVAILDGDASDPFAVGLAKGYNAVLGPLFESRKYVKVDQQSIPGGNPDTAQTVFDQMLAAAGNRIDGVLAPNDAMADAVLASLRLRQLPVVPVTGLGGGVAALQRILAEQQSFTVYFSYNALAKEAADLAVQLARGEQPEGLTMTATTSGGDLPTLLVEPVLVRKKTIETTVIADGLVTWDDLCTEQYIEFCPE